LNGSKSIRGLDDGFPSAFTSKKSQEGYIEARNAVEKERKRKDGC
jgi:hypothetical protein